MHVLYRSVLWRRSINGGATTSLHMSVLWQNGIYWINLTGARHVRAFRDIIWSCKFLLFICLCSQFWFVQMRLLVTNFNITGGDLVVRAQKVSWADLKLKEGPECCVCFCNFGIVFPFFSGKKVTVLLR